MAELLPPSIADSEDRVRWTLIWPGHGHLDVWLVDGVSPDFAMERAELAALLLFAVTPEVDAAFPATWCWQTTLPDGVPGRELELWSRETAVRAAALHCPDMVLSWDFGEWIGGHRQLLVRDYPGMVKDSIPALRSGFGEGYTVDAIAKRLSARYGQVTRAALFSRMVALDWVDVVDRDAELGRYRPTPRGVGDGLVFTRPCRVPGKPGIYRQVLATLAGFTALEEDLRSLLAEEEGADDE